MPPHSSRTCSHRQNDTFKKKQLPQASIWKLIPVERPGDDIFCLPAVSAGRNWQRLRPEIRVTLLGDYISLFIKLSRSRNPMTCLLQPIIDKNETETPNDRGFFAKHALVLDHAKRKLRMLESWPSGTYHFLSDLVLLLLLPDHLVALIEESIVNRQAFPL